jgi:hypothetical protein
MHTIGKITSLLVLAVEGTLIKGFLLMKFYAWFIASTFGVSELTLVQALGLSFFVGFLTFKYKEDEAKRTTTEVVTEAKRTTTEVVTEALGIYLVGHPLILLMGWILSLFM